MWQHTSARLLAVVYLVCMTGVPMGCSDDPRSASSRADGEALASPLQVAEALRVWHRQRRYRLFEGWVVPEQRMLLEDTLMAFGRLLDANARAQEVLVAEHGEFVAANYDLGSLANSLGFFSEDAVFRGERIDGDRATVVVQVADRLPLEEFRFVRHKGRWVFAPSGPLPELPQRVSELVKGLDEFAEAVQRGPMDLKDVKLAFSRHVVRRQEAIRKALTAATSQPSAPADAAGR